MIGMLMNVVYGKVQKSEQKHITKESVKLHNHSTCVTIDYISKANVLMSPTCSTVNTSL